MTARNVHAIGQVYRALNVNNAIWLAFVCGLATPVLAQAPRPVFEIQRSAQPPIIDGKLADICWLEAPVLTNFTQVLPVEGAAPSERTEVRMVYTLDYLYIGVRCYDSEPEKIIAKQMQHDGSLMSDDFVKIAFDTFSRQRDGYFFAVNPAGARTEGVIENFSDENVLWDTIWHARACTDAQGWTAEIAIPFKSLSFDAHRGSWGCNIERVIRRKQEIVRWTAICRAKAMTSLADFGELRGLQGMRQGLGLEAKPFLSIKYLEEAETDAKQWKLRPGGDITSHITPSLKANVTFYTDFAEAEVDERMVNLTRFPLFFPEKRDFFLQDSALFRFGGLAGPPLLPYYSRRIGLSANGQPVDLIVGGRFTGRIGNTSIALLDVLQDNYSANSGGHVQSKNLFVGRFSTLVLEESNVGVICTYGDPLTNGDNVLGGVDFNYLNTRLPSGKTLVGHAWLIGTSSDRARGEDVALGGMLDFPNEPFQAQFAFRHVGEKFDPALGFVERSGIREFNSQVDYIWRPNTAWLRRISLGAQPNCTTDLANRLVAENHDVPVLALQTHAGDSLMIEHDYTRDVVEKPFNIYRDVVIPPGDYAFSQFVAWVFTSEARVLSMRFHYRNGNFYTGSRRNYSGGIDWRPSRHITMGAAYRLNEIRLREGEFDTRIASARLNLAFSPDLSWNTLVQYDNLSDVVGLQSRIRWMYRPGSDLFLVVGQSWDFDDWHSRMLTSEVTVKATCTFRF